MFIWLPISPGPASGENMTSNDNDVWASHHFRLGSHPPSTDSSEAPRTPRSQSGRDALPVHRSAQRERLHSTCHSLCTCRQSSCRVQLPLRHLRNLVHDMDHTPIVKLAWREEMPFPIAQLIQLRALLNIAEMPSRNSRRGRFLREVTREVTILERLINCCCRNLKWV